jgi:hypothetical protein
MSIIRKPGIPAMSHLPKEMADLLRPIKETLEIMTGARGGAVQQLPVGAGLPAVVQKINELIARLNQAGV